MSILIIDGNNTAWKAFHKYKNLRHGKYPAAVIYGMPSIVNGIIKKFKPEKTFIVWDGSKSQHRLKICPQYKGNRGFNPDYIDFNKQKALVMRAFFYLGIAQVIHPELEADDYIYMLQRKYVREGHNVTIVSSDKDFKQLITSKVQIWDSTKDILLTNNNLKDVTGLTAKQHLDYLILDGDTSDNIKGYKGMGKVRLGVFFSKFKSIKQFLDSKEEYKHIDRKTLLDLLKINIPLIDLRYFYNTFLRGKVKILYYMNKKTPKFRKEKFINICKKYSIKTFQQETFLKNYEK